MKNQNKSRNVSSRAITKQAVKQMISSKLEHKYIVGTNSGTTVLAGTMVYKSIIAQDDTISGRTGDKITPDSLTYLITLQDAVNSFVRLLIFQDTSNNGASPSVTDVLSSAGVTAMYNPAYHLSKRFRILLDKNYDLSITGAQVVTDRGTIRMRLPLHFIGTGATAADGGKNSLYAIVIGGTATATYTLTTGLQYTDA